MERKIIELDYEAIGRRIKHIRESHNITQDGLADMVHLSVQHISNIERAYTKLSLPALVQIANALNVQPDQLICDSVYTSKEIFTDELAELVGHASDTELKIMVQIFKSMIPTLRKYYLEGSKI